MIFAEILSLVGAFYGQICSKTLKNYLKYNKNAYKMQKKCQNICTCQKIAVLLCGISVKRITKSHLKSSAASEKHMLFLATARRGCSKFFLIHSLLTI